MTYRLYGVRDFANLAVHLALEATGAPYEAIFLDPDDLKSPAHLARHPLGMVPMLETPDGPMIETAAILLWLADRHGGLAPAPDSPQRAASPALVPPGKTKQLLRAPGEARIGLAAALP